MRNVATDARPTYDAQHGSPCSIQDAPWIRNPYTTRAEQLLNPRRPIHIIFQNASEKVSKIVSKPLWGFLELNPSPVL